jgi:hypothetical protein
MQKEMNVPCGSSQSRIGIERLPLEFVWNELFC